MTTDIVTIQQASFETRQQLVMTGRIVEYSLAELDVLGAVADDVPVSEEDFIDTDEGVHHE